MVVVVVVMVVVFVAGANDSWAKTGWVGVELSMTVKQQKLSVQKERRGLIRCNVDSGSDVELQYGM